ncbi:uncharacterized protein [Elaeis guineensis]|uniref:uncharacterized protein n=1 Tax=Elaeis guineensis var. tenera TaxID=51953 RepID=UPI003C6D0BA6
MGQTWVRSGGLHLGGRPSLNPFQVATDCEGALCGGQWFVAGQLLAVEPWVSGFMLAVKVVRRTVVWVLLLSLPMVFWGSEMLKGIVTEAEKPVAADESTYRCWKTGFARFRVEIDTGEPLKLGVLIRSHQEVFWQAFVYENVPAICYRCGRIGHSDEECHFPSEEKEGGHLLRPENFMAVEGEAASEVLATVTPPRMGPWMATSRIRQPRPVRVPVKPKGMVDSNPDSSTPNSSPSRPSSP